METIGPSDYIFKIIALGSASVGKTSITLRFATDKFQDDYKMTLGMNLSTRNVKVLDKNIQIAIWDTAGQASFEPLLPLYYRGTLGALIVYDITNRKSFEKVDKWIHDIKQYAGEIPIIIIGNKTDLEDQRQVTKSEGEELLKKFQLVWTKPIHFRETSAKEAYHVNESFEILASTILDFVKDEVDEDDDDLLFDFDKTDNDN